MIFWFFICILKMNIHCMCTLFVGVSGCITYCLHIYECCTVIYENYKLLLTLSSAMRFSNKGPSATFRYTKYTSKVNIESMCCKLMGFLFQSVTSCYLNFSIWPAKKVNCKNNFLLYFQLLYLWLRPIAGSVKEKSIWSQARCQQCKICILILVHIESNITFLFDFFISLFDFLLYLCIK